MARLMFMRTQRCRSSMALASTSASSSFLTDTKIRCISLIGWALRAQSALLRHVQKRSYRSLIVSAPSILRAAGMSSKL